MCDFKDFKDVQRKFECLYGEYILNDFKHFGGASDFSFQDKEKFEVKLKLYVSQCLSLEIFYNENNNKIGRYTRFVFLTIEYYNRISSEKLENKIINLIHKNITDENEFHIEHIIPRSEEDDWSKVVINSIGNLTLLDAWLNTNRRYSDQSYECKRNEFLKKEHEWKLKARYLMINNFFQSTEKFDEDVIESRKEYLLHSFKSIFYPEMDLENFEFSAENFYKILASVNDEDCKKEKKSNNENP